MGNLLEGAHDKYVESEDLKDITELNAWLRRTNRMYEFHGSNEPVDLAIEIKFTDLLIRYMPGGVHRHLREFMNREIDKNRLYLPQYFKRRIYRRLMSVAERYPQLGNDERVDLRSAYVEIIRHETTQDYRKDYTKEEVEQQTRTMLMECPLEEKEKIRTFDSEYAAFLFLKDLFSKVFVPSNEVLETFVKWVRRGEDPTKWYETNWLARKSAIPNMWDDWYDERECLLYESKRHSPLMTSLSWKFVPREIMVDSKIAMEKKALERGEVHVDMQADVKSDEKIENSSEEVVLSNSKDTTVEVTMMKGSEYIETKSVETSNDILVLCEMKVVNTYDYKTVTLKNSMRLMRQAMMSPKGCEVKYLKKTRVRISSSWNDDGIIIKNRMKRLTVRISDKTSESFVVHFESVVAVQKMDVMEPQDENVAFSVFFEKDDDNKFYARDICQESKWVVKSFSVVGSEVSPERLQEIYTERATVEREKEEAERRVAEEIRRLDELRKKEEEEQRRLREDWERQNAKKAEEEKLRQVQQTPKEPSVFEQPVTVSDQIDWNVSEKVTTPLQTAFGGFSQLGAVPLVTQAIQQPSAIQEAVDIFDNSRIYSETSKKTTKKRSR